MPTALRSRAWLLLAASITLQLVIIRSVRVLKHDLDLTSDGLQPRDSVDVSVRSLVSLPYEDWYLSAPPILRPFVALGILILLAFLFSFIGISASDFFCPNLSTIASYLGLSESTAGVTFLAFGNGSPDVFSTFAALNNDSFGLAIGELIGAASFIVSIVVGTIALIRPFHVPRTAFIRDVTFFLAAVLILIWSLHDGRLTLPESGGMVGLYGAYVGVVVLGNVWARRRRDRAARKALRKGDREDFEALEQPSGTAGIGNGHGEGDGQLTPLPNLTLPSPTMEESGLSQSHVAENRRIQPASPLLSPASSPRSRPISRLPSLPRLPSLAHAHSHAQPHTLASHLHPSEDEDYVDTPRANFSLLGAIEFRDVVNSLRKTSGSRSPSPVSGTPTGDDHGDYFSRPHRRSSSHDFAVSPILARSASRVTRGRRRTVSTQPGSRMVQSPLVPHPSAPLTAVEPHPPSHPDADRIAQTDQSPPEPNPWQDHPSLTPPTHPTHPSHPAVPPLGKPDRPRVLIPPQISPRPSHTPAIPSISVIDPSGIANAPSGSGESSPTPSPPPPSSSESRFRLRRRARTTLRILFPSLQSFRHKSILGMIIAVFSVPAILALTLTLPVVDDGRDGNGDGAIALPVGEDEPLVHLDEESEIDEAGDDEFDEGGDRLLSPEVGEELHHLVESGFSPLHSPLGRIHHSALRRASHDPEAALSMERGLDEEQTKELLEEIAEEEALDFQPALAAVQCVAGPAFCGYIVFQGTDYLRWVLIACVAVGAVLGVIVATKAVDGTRQPWRLARCFAGFVCSLVWIAAIADEVVSVLRAVGELMGLSDAIIGLTIFAVGNSLADLVANATVAQFAPAMAYAACFGGPMLNLLLGVGGSGSYHMLLKSHSPVVIDFSPTLWVSAAGLVLILVATIIFVPLNGFLIDRRWAGCLIAAYVVLMCVNVGVEIKTGRG